jgi:hypothetical protein
LAVVPAFVRKGVEEQVDQAQPRKILGHRNVIREHESLGVDVPPRGFLAQMVDDDAMAGHEPKDATWDVAEQAHPEAEHLRQDLVAAVEATEDEPALRQAHSTRLGIRGLISRRVSLGQ